mmetsp:Transcript_3853/g.5480  ORF Transcript_3853/g.5480 Transcript_3853/m.5480 type:complete len:199 (-) Transcript_3853:274-870(-)
MLELIAAKISSLAPSAIKHGNAKIVPPDYLWICIGFTVLVLGGMIGGVYAILQKNMLRIRRRWYSWCLLCDKKRHRISISELKHESYNTFGVSPAEQIVLKIFNEHSPKTNEDCASRNEKFGRDWTPLQGGLKSVESCPNIYGREFQASKQLLLAQGMRKWKMQRSSSSSAMNASHYQLVVVDEDTEDEETDREDLFL